MTTQITLNIYKVVIESVLTFSITVWFGSITVKEKVRLNRVVNTASKIIARSLPSLESLYQQRLLRRAGLISHDPSHPAHDLFEPLPSSCRCRSIKTRTSRFSNSFYPVAVQAFMDLISIPRRENLFPSAVHTNTTFRLIYISK